MAHASCPNNHGMWDGDGKPVVWAFRVNYLREFERLYPDFVLDDDWRQEGHVQLYDCVDDAPGEDLDCWYCDECKGLVVYVDLLRYDFKRMESIPSVAYTDVEDWEDYIALRDREFEEFQEFYQGMTPMEAIEKYPFKYWYKLSPDKKTILAFDEFRNVAFGYWQSNYKEFSPYTEVKIHAGGKTISYFPYAHFQDNAGNDPQYIIEHSLPEVDGTENV